MDKNPTLEQVELFARDMCRRKELTWMGFRKDDNDRYTIPVISSSEYKLVLAVIKAYYEREAPSVQPAHEVMRQALSALEMAFAQNDYDMKMTGEETRQCESAITALRAAIAAQPAEPASKIIVTRNEAGAIVAVTRQDTDGRILEVIAEATTHPAKREGCDYIVAAGKLCRKCGSVHQPGR